MHLELDLNVHVLLSKRLQSIINLSIHLMPTTLRSNLWSCSTLMAGAQNSTVIAEAVLAEEVAALEGEIAETELFFSACC